MNITPSRRFITLLALWTLLGLIPAFFPAALLVWLGLGGVLLSAAAIDTVLLPPQLQAQRFVNNILPVGVWSHVRLRVHNRASRAQRIKLFDHYLQPAEFSELPQTVTVAANRWSEISYRLRPLQRGRHEFGPLQAVTPSALGLWRRATMLADAQSVRVYPNFANIAKFALLAHDNRINAMGIHQRRRRGEGQDFFQLREYRDGDNLRQVDWKATARHRKLISKEYQDERDQRVVFLLDCSRRMRAQDDDLSHFDHALNAMILLSYVALRQGDAVGVLSFGGNNRWLAAKKGQGMLNTVINSVYDLQPTLHTADYSSVADQLMARQNRRALVIMLTNLRDDDNSDLVPALRLMRQRHLLLIANLRESILDTTLQQTVDNFQQARLYAATCHYLAARDHGQEVLRQNKALVLDSQPQDLPVALVNQYLDIKRSGRL